MRSFRLSPVLGSIILLVTLAITSLVAGQNSAPSGWTPELSMKVKAVGSFTMR